MLALVLQRFHLFERNKLTWDRGTGCTQAAMARLPAPTGSPGVGPTATSYSLLDTFQYADLSTKAMTEWICAFEGFAGLTLIPRFGPL